MQRQLQIPAKRGGQIMFTALASLCISYCRVRFSSVTLTVNSFLLRQTLSATT